MNPDSLPAQEIDSTNDHLVHKKKEKVIRPFDLSKYPLRHIALKIAYIGWNSHGFAAQADSDETIEVRMTLFGAAKLFLAHFETG